MTTTTEKVARRKLSLLELASNLDNVSKACKLMGYSRQQFYEIRRNFQTFGADGLIDRLPGARGPHPNRVPAASHSRLCGLRRFFPDFPRRFRALANPSACRNARWRGFADHLEARLERGAHAKWRHLRLTGRVALSWRNSRNRAGARPGRADRAEKSASG